MELARVKEERFFMGREEGAHRSSCLQLASFCESDEVTLDY